jgi:hypothetical protein
MACCICLDTPTYKYPTYLLACGCNEAWFHIECEKKWLNSFDTPTCPTCRQTVPFQKVYSFAYESGPEQKSLRTLEILFILECLFYLTRGLYTAPLSCLILLSIPFTLRTPHSLGYYIDMTKFKIVLDILLYIIQTDESITSAGDVAWVIVCMYNCLFLYNSYPYQKDPLEQFVIETEIVHTQCLYSMKLIPKTIAIPDYRHTYIFYLPPST